MMRIPAATLAVALFTTPAQAFDWQQASEHSGLSIRHLYAIGLAESQYTDQTGRIRPWPWTLNVGGKPKRYNNRAAAARALEGYLAEGNDLIDVGGMQVNLRWHASLVEKPTDLLDPRVNLWAAVKVLRGCRRIAGPRLTRVLSCYHAGPGDEPAGRRYAEKVTQLADQLVPRRPAVESIEPIRSPSPLHATRIVVYSGTPQPDQDNAHVPARDTAIAPQ